MDDQIYRGSSIAEENINPNGRPAKNKFGEWAEQMTDRTQMGYQDQEPISDEERQRRLKAIDEVLDAELKHEPGKEE